ncbi:hemolysin family protein [Streptomyces zingiberis]|uniref:HlyC/CorC family transporter n=1 Tax=Streptomyces zingiberis TaxID=2053010 RepID=A0ABX1C354_9ACTN|nr:hemolysin family protein [Streptomyces zingiberis]NJQ03110.1 HlyC/CorC family transporter [Streptomyces zingiberis]
MTALQLLFGTVLLLGNAFFVGAEFALVSVRRSQIEPLAAAGSARARTVLTGLENLPQMMAAAQFGITACSLTLGAVAEPTVARLLEPLCRAAGLPAPAAHALGYAVALALVVVLHLVVGEMVPKNLALAAPGRTALRLGPPLVAFARLCRPVTGLLGACARQVLRLFRVETRDELETVYTREQLGRLVADSHQAGLLAPEERARLADALGLGSRTVAEVLLDPASLVTVGPDATARQIERLTVRTGFSRFPVHGGGGPGPAGFLGYVHVKDVLDPEEEPDAPGPDAAGPDPALSPRVLRPMPVLRPGTPLDDALTAMRRAAAHLAQVADASGRVLGLVTLEDVLETLVGEVRDPAHRARAGLTAQRGARVVPRRPRPARPRTPARDRAGSGPVAGLSAGADGATGHEPP